MLCFSLIFTAIASSPQGDEPVGGRHAPLWSSRKPTGGLIERTVDLTGDGLADVLDGADYSGGIRIVDARDGSDWLVLDLVRWNTQVTPADVDGDGVHDLVVGEPRFDAGSGYPDPGRIAVWRGGSARLAWQVEGTDAAPGLGDDLSVADVDGDGLADVVAVTPEVERLALRGYDGRELWRFADVRAESARLVHDLDGDGAPDLLIAEDGALRAVSGRSGVALWTTPHPTSSPSLRASVSTLAHDLDGDGLPELILNEPRAEGEAGAVTVLRAIDGTRLWRRTGGAARAQLGREAALEDLDGDGTPEWIDAIDDKHRDEARITVLDLRSGARRWQRTLPHRVDPGPAIHRTDLNADGAPDFVVAASWPDDTASVHALDARTGRELWPVMPVLRGGAIQSIAPGDSDGDSWPDFFVAGRDFGAQGQGRVLAVSGATGGVLWRRPGVEPWDSFGVPLHHVPRAGAPDLLYTTSSPVLAGTPIHRLDPSTGNLLWTVHAAGLYRGLEEVRTDDLDGDGRPELFARAYNSNDAGRGFWTAWDALTGDALWSSGGLTGPPPWNGDAWLGADADLDGDGWRDPLLVTQLGAHTQRRSMAISGRVGTWTAGLASSEDTVSQSAGGSAVLTVSAGPERGRDHYGVLFSENGPGVARFGAVDVPLAPSRWLTRTAVGLYPSGVFSAPSGRLSDDGCVRIDLHIGPGQIPAWVGRTLAFSVWTSNDLGNGPTWSTGHALLNVLP